ncbi:hypothetical protein O181_039342 [Austropuccinia psidii MF-1]|uniref:Uncharacterized protein n=1 Tax=Austropuccinia psidii MF-1 TaxID=1389203 RepID=A0A9Q3DCQ4_9BASI|nr:hypothetical protein [Austropuccinia psidii MF-1]
MSPVHLRNLGFQMTQPEDREGLSRTRIPGRGNLGHSGGWQNTEGNHTHPSIHFPIQQEPQNRGLERHGSSSSAPQTPQRCISMEHGQQEVQPGIPLGRNWRKLPEDMSQRDILQRPYGNNQRLESHQAVQTPGGERKQNKEESNHYPRYSHQLLKDLFQWRMDNKRFNLASHWAELGASCQKIFLKEIEFRDLMVITKGYRRTADPDRASSDAFRLTRSRPNQISSGFTPFRNQQISGKE